MNRHEHYETAEHIAVRVGAVMESALDGALDANDVTIDAARLEVARTLTALAQVHATLANVPV